MKRLIDLTNDEARNHLLKGSCYFNSDFPPYIDFTPILKSVDSVLDGKAFFDFMSITPNNIKGVNYSFTANKDGRFAWRPHELIHPVIYVSFINIICKPENWTLIQKRFNEFSDGIVDCCSAPVMSLDDYSDAAKQVQSWWHKLEQRSLKYALLYSHILHTDVTDCYGSLYTHAISWALHGVEESKIKRSDKSLLGNQVDRHIRAGRYGQTNGISQGSVVMDFIAELVLGFIDKTINEAVGDADDIKILRYRDDYRIFGNSDQRVEEILKIVSDQLREVGMKLSIPKTKLCRNVIEGSIKSDKLAGIDLKDLGDTNARTFQKKLLRLHSFGQKYPNSGALRRLITEFNETLEGFDERLEDIEVLISIATDIGFVSPSTFPVVSSILSHLISLSKEDEKKDLWEKVRNKMKKVPYNGYLEIWLQRVTQPKAVGIRIKTKENICRIVNGEDVILWDNSWISSPALLRALDVTQIVISTPEDIDEVVQLEEVALFAQKALAY